MPKQTIPDIHFDRFVLARIPKLFDNNEVFINKEYQRGNIWKPKMKVELIRSILNGYSIGVLVVFENDQGQYEILDGQQRLLTIRDYVKGDLNLLDSELPKYADLEFDDQKLVDAYCVFYLKLVSLDPKSREENIFQTFLRLQEGSPLNKAEKINAYRGLFKDTFRDAREKSQLFALLGDDKRFRWRQLSAEMLLIELEADFKRMIFPDLDMPSLIRAAKTYENKIPTGKVRLFHANLEFLYSSLNVILTAFTAREVIAFYLLVSYLRKFKANNSNMHNEVAEFAKEFLKNLNSFSIYDPEPPNGMNPKIFQQYRKFKEASKVLTTSESLTDRLKIMLAEFKRIHPIITKDPQRFHDTEQKRILYFRQKGLCSECGKEMNFDLSTSHHIYQHAKGGPTDDLTKAILIHERCHRKLEKRLRKQKNASK